MLQLIELLPALHHCIRHLESPRRKQCSELGELVEADGNKKQSRSGCLFKNLYRAQKYRPRLYAASIDSMGIRRHQRHKQSIAFGEVSQIKPEQKFHTPSLTPPPPSCPKARSALLDSQICKLQYSAVDPSSQSKNSPPVSPTGGVSRATSTKKTGYLYLHLDQYVSPTSLMRFLLGGGPIFPAVFSSSRT